MQLSSTAGMQGLGFRTETFVGKASEAISKGQVVECLLTTLEPDDDISIAIANAATVGIYGVATEDIASGKRGVCVLSGKVEILGGDAATAGSPIMPNSSGQVVAHGGEPTVAVGFCVDTLAVGVLKTCLFDGFRPQRTGDFAA